MSLSSLGGSEVAAVAAALQQPAENYTNDPQLEMMWAVKAFEHAEVYFNLLKAVDPKVLRICPISDKLYEEFRKDFPDFKVDRLIEDEIKSVEGKAKWREFCNKFDGQVVDWNMATLLRLDSEGDISEHNTTIVPRIQFLAIETARNKEGCNSSIRHRYGNLRNCSENPHSGST